MFGEGEEGEGGAVVGFCVGGGEEEGVRCVGEGGAVVFWNFRMGLAGGDDGVEVREEWGRRMYLVPDYTAPDLHSTPPRSSSPFLSPPALIHHHHPRYSTPRSAVPNVS